MSLNELTNEEILYFYFSNKLILENYNKIFEMGGVEDVIDILDAGRITIYHRYTEDALNEIAEEPYYLAVKQMHLKFEPIALMIQETDPSLFSRVEQDFLNSELN
jgi:hypothetical protein